MAANGKCIVDAGTLTVDNLNTSDTGDLKVNTNKFTVANASGNTVIAGTLAVTGATTITGALTANGGITCDTNKFTVADTSGNTVIGGTLAVTGTTTSTGNLIVGANKVVATAATGATTFAAAVTATGFKVSALQTAPASASATGTTGDIRFVANAIYLCVDTDTWVKVALATWT